MEKMISEEFFKLVSCTCLMIYEAGFWKGVFEAGGGGFLLVCCGIVQAAFCLLVQGNGKFPVTYRMANLMQIEEYVVINVSYKILKGILPGSLIEDMEM